MEVLEETFELLLELIWECFFWVITKVPAIGDWLRRLDFRWSYSAKVVMIKERKGRVYFFPCCFNSWCLLTSVWADKFPGFMNNRGWSCSWFNQGHVAPKKDREFAISLLRRQNQFYNGSSNSLLLIDLDKDGQKL